MLIRRHKLRKNHGAFPIWILPAFERDFPLMHKKKCNHPSKWSPHWICQFTFFFRLQHLFVKRHQSVRKLCERNLRLEHSKLYKNPLTRFNLCDIHRKTEKKKHVKKFNLWFMIYCCYLVWYIAVFFFFAKKKVVMQKL